MIRRHIITWWIGLRRLNRESGLKYLLPLELSIGDLPRKRFSILMPLDYGTWQIIKELLLDREYELVEGFELESLPAKSVVLDLGAHVGIYSIIASVYSDTVIAVEPHPFNYALFKLNIKTNKINNVKLVNKAVYNKEGIVLLHINLNNSGGHSVIFDFKHSGYKIKAVTLDRLVEPLDRVDLLKMDVEGAEHDILLSSKEETFDKIERIVGEMHVIGYMKSFEKIVERLRRNGYQVTLIRPPVIRYLKKEFREKIRVYNPRINALNRIRSIYLKSFEAKALKELNLILYAIKRY